MRQVALQQQLILHIYPCCLLLGWMHAPALHHMADDVCTVPAGCMHLLRLVSSHDIDDDVNYTYLHAVCRQSTCHIGAST